jgi:hypothetical protein
VPESSPLSNEMSDQVKGNEPANQGAVENPEERIAPMEEGDVASATSVESQASGPPITFPQTVWLKTYIETARKGADSVAKTSWLNDFEELARSFAEPGGASSFEQFRDDLESIETRMKEDPNSAKKEYGSLDLELVQELRSYFSNIASVGQSSAVPSG